MTELPPISIHLILWLIIFAGGVPRGGIPDVGCSGNVSMGADSIWFGNTDSSPHFIVTDLVKLMEN